MDSGKGGQILDKDFTDGVAHKVHDFQKAAREGYLDTQKFVHQKDDEFGAMVQAHPKSFVLGAFIGGIALGALLPRGHKHT